MKEGYHSAALGDRWFSLSLAEQLGNVGSEVSRALKWRVRDAAIAERALHRAIELIDLTLDDPRHRLSVARLRELCRVREVLLDFMLGTNEFGSTQTDLQRYFDAFVIAAMNARARSSGSAS